MNCKLGLLTAFCLVLGGASVARADVINTVSSWDGSQGFAYFGAGQSPTYGEQFNLTSTTVVNNFTFYLESLAGSHLQYTAAIYAWDPTMGSITGPALFVSSGNTLDYTGSFQEVTTDTGGVTLQGGGEYVAFFTLTAADASATTGGPWVWGYGSTTSTTSQLVFSNVGDPANLTATSPQTSPWNAFGNGTDFAFSINQPSIAATPEPGSLALLGTGLLGTVGIVRRRQRA